MTPDCDIDGPDLSGRATWRLDDDALVIAPSAGNPVTVALAEVSGIGGDGHTLTLTVGRETLTLAKLGADGPGLASTLRTRWLPLRAQGLRLTGRGAGKPFAGALLGGPRPVPFGALLHDDVLLLAAEGRDVDPVFLALVDSVGHDEAEYAIEVKPAVGRRLRLGRMAAQTAPFVAALRAARTTLADRAAATLAANLPTLLPAARIALAARWLPGRIIAIDELERLGPGFTDAFASSWLPACPRRANAAHLLAWAEAGRAFVGYGSLDRVPPAGEEADDTGEGGQGPAADTLLVMLAGKGSRWALEALSVGDFATYLFQGGPDMQQLASQLLCAPQFSREALYLPLERLVGGRAELAIASRDLPFLGELRRHFTGRVVHGDKSAWKRSLD